MIPTPQQNKAIKGCVARIKAKEPVTRLFGFAGTGKTTIAKMIAEEFGGNVAFASYTGKAASVLTRKGCPATTIHAMFYNHVGERKVKNSLQPVFEFSRDKAARPQALILDEVSMVGKEMGADIMSAKIPIIAIGDPAQLPPIGDGGYFTNGNPDFMLTEVMRHEGGILDLATDIRVNGLGALGMRKYRSIVRESIPQSTALEYDQILVGKNDTRRDKNATIRKLKEVEDGEFIAVGDRIICTANSASHEVLNGQQFRVVGIDEDLENDYKKDSMIYLVLECECFPSGEFPDTRCTICGWHRDKTPVWVAGFGGPKGEEWLTKQPFFKRKKAMEATYGYAVTVHKAQGSEWDNVLVVNESYCFRKDAARWLYTAITRAQSSLTIIASR